MKCIAAAEFVFFRDKDTDRTSLSSCSGTVKHMCKLCEGEVYEYKLDSQLTSGSVELILTDRKKQQILKLDNNNTVGKAEIDRNNRYYLQWKFKERLASVSFTGSKYLKTYNNICTDHYCKST